MENEKRNQNHDYYDYHDNNDPLANFSDDKYNYTEEFSSTTLDENISNFGGIPYMGEVDDYFARNFGDFDYSEPSRERRERKRREEAEKQKNQSKLGSKKSSPKLTSAQRKTRRVIAYVFVFLSIIIISIIFSVKIMFKTKEIIVEADGLPYSSQEIISASGIDPNKSIFSSKKKAVKKTLVENYPYIEDADVEVKIPGTQIIKIQVAIPSYQVQFSGGYAVISENCRILEINDVQKINIPLLKGLKLKNLVVGEYITFEKESTKRVLDEVVKNINENEVKNIYGIDISNTANIELNYDNRITILLGLPEDVGYKLRTAKAIINQALSATDKGTLDVSLANSERRSSYFTPIHSYEVESDSDKPEYSQNNSDNNYDSENNDNDYLDDIIAD